MKKAILFVLVIVFSLSVSGCYLQFGDWYIGAYYKTPNKAFFEYEYDIREAGTFESEIYVAEIDNVALYLFKTDQDYLIIAPLRIKNNKYAGLGRYTGWCGDIDDFTSFTHQRISLSDGQTLFYGLIRIDLKEKYLTENMQYYDFQIELSGKVWNISLYYFCEEL